VEDGVAHIKDLFPPGDDTAARDLIAGVIREGRRNRLQSLSVVTLEGNPLDRLFAEFGFLVRPGDSEMFTYAPQQSPLRNTVMDAGSWFISVGDRDV